MGFGGVVGYSTDGGANWFAGTSVSGSIFWSVAYNNTSGRFVDVGAGVVEYSITSGVSWTSGTSFTAVNDLFSVVIGQ